MSTALQGLWLTEREGGFFRHNRRTAPKYGTHVRIKTLTLKQNKHLTHPTPGGFRGISIVKDHDRPLERQTHGTDLRIRRVSPCFVEAASAKAD